MPENAEDFSCQGDNRLLISDTIFQFTEICTEPGIFCFVHPVGDGIVAPDSKGFSLRGILRGGEVYRIEDMTETIPGDYAHFENCIHTMERRPRYTVSKIRATPIKTGIEKWPAILRAFMKKSMRGKNRQQSHSCRPSLTGLFFRSPVLEYQPHTDFIYRYHGSQCNL